MEMRILRVGLGHILCSVNDQNAVDARGEVRKMRPVSHCAGIGSTTLQPVIVGTAVHRAKVGNTLPQPGSVGVAIHCANDGGGVVGKYLEGICVSIDPYNDAMRVARRTRNDRGKPSQT